MSYPYEVLTGWDLRIIEASANSFHKTPQIGALLKHHRSTVRSHELDAYERLEISHCGVPQARAITTSIKAGLFRPDDLKMPGEPFIFTLYPPVSKFFDYKNNPPRQVEYPLMPKKDDEAMAIRIVRARQRTYLSCLSVGMSLEEMHADPEIPTTSPAACRRVLERACKNLGLLNFQQAVAHAALFDIIHVDPNVLVCGAVARPFVYEEGDDAVVGLNRPSYRAN